MGSTTMTVDQQCKLSHRAHEAIPYRKVCAFTRAPRTISSRMRSLQHRTTTAATPDVVHVQTQPSQQRQPGVDQSSELQTIAYGRKLQQLLPRAVALAAGVAVLSVVAPHAAQAAAAAASDGSSSLLKSEKSNSNYLQPSCIPAMRLLSLLPRLSPVTHTGPLSELLSLRHAASHCVVQVLSALYCI